MIEYGSREEQEDEDCVSELDEYGAAAGESPEHVGEMASSGAEVSPTNMAHGASRRRVGEMAASGAKVAPSAVDVSPRGVGEMATSGAEVAPSAVGAMAGRMIARFGTGT